MSHVKCPMSGVRCHVYCVIFEEKYKKNIKIGRRKKVYKGVELVGGGSVINTATPPSFMAFTLTYLKADILGVAIVRKYS